MITIHCGLHKTGSSAIQLALSGVSRGARRKIVTPNPGDDRSDEGWARRLSVLADTRDAIFSDENLLGEPYDGYQSAPERVSIVRRSLAGARYQIVVYLRPQVDWLGSVYLQGVQEGRTVEPGEFWSTLASRHFLSWSSLVKLLQEQSGADRVIVRAYARSRDSVADFMTLCGPNALSRVGRRAIRDNVSISPLQAPILVALNKESELTEERRRRRREVFQSLLANQSAPPQSPFQQSIQREITERFRDDWQAVTDAIERSDPDEHALFSQLGSEWDKPPLSFLGDSVEDAAVSQELLRCLSILLDNVNEPRSHGVWARAWTKLHDDPLDLLGAMARRVGRWELQSRS